MQITFQIAHTEQEHKAIHHVPSSYKQSFTTSFMHCPLEVQSKVKTNANPTRCGRTCLTWLWDIQPVWVNVSLNVIAALAFSSSSFKASSYQDWKALGTVWLILAQNSRTFILLVSA